MNQTDIDRYNKGQDKWELKIIDGLLIMTRLSLPSTYIKDASLYDFLFNPKWGWREMFDKDPDYQQEFWEWMAVYNNLDHYPKGIIRGAATPQMLTGYILEFMQERMK